MIDELQLPKRYDITADINIAIIYLIISTSYLSLSLRSLTINLTGVPIRPNVDLI